MARVMPGWPRGGLWRHRNFLHLWGAQAISACGSRIAREGLPLAAVLTIDAEPAELGLLAALTAAPAIAVGLVAGGAVDRLRKRPLLIGADLLRALLLLTVPATAFVGWLTMEQLYVVAAGMGGLNALFRIADNAYLPVLIPRDRLVEGNAKLEATDAAAEIAGPALAGILVQLLSVPFALLVNAATYLGSAWFLRRIDSEEPVATPPGPRGLPIGDLATGLRACLSQPFIRPLLLATTTTSLGGGFFAALYVIYAVDVLGLSPAALGLTIACGGGGALAGALLAPRLVDAAPLGPVIIAAFAVSAAASILIPLAPATPLLAMAILMAAQVIGDGAAVCGIVQEVSLRQSLLPTGVLGRVNAAIQVLTGTLLAAGALCAGVLAEVAGPRFALLCGAAIMAVAPILLFFSPVRRLARMPQPPAGAET